MTGVLMAAAAAGAPTGYTGSPGTIAWGDIAGISGGSTGSVTLTGITGSMTITATNSGPSQLYYTLGGANILYAGAFQWAEGQALTWYVIGAGSGTIVVSSDGSELDSFGYVITAPNPRSSGGGVQP